MNELKFIKERDLKFGDSWSMDTEGLADALCDYANAQTQKLVEVLEVIEACGEPSKISMYDEEGVGGWRWTHPDGREWTSTGLWENEAPPHPIVREMLNEFGRK